MSAGTIVHPFACPVHPPAVCCDHLHADRLLDDLVQLAVEIFATTYLLEWNDAWSAAREQQGGLLQYAARWDAEAAAQEASACVNWNS